MRKWLIILIIVFMIVYVSCEYSSNGDIYLYVYKYMYVKHNKVDKIIEEEVWQSAAYYYIYNYESLSGADKFFTKKYDTVTNLDETINKYQNYFNRAFSYLFKNIDLKEIINDDSLIYEVDKTDDREVYLRLYVYNQKEKKLHYIEIIE